MANMTVVRNNPLARSDVALVEKHNERKNVTYSNPDVILEQTANNIHFKRCDTAYTQTFDDMVKDKEISTRGLQENAYIMGEMIFDVNSRYFEDNGGYEFAKKFYEEAYKFACQQVGDERYILSAVMHADERNSALSEELGKDVFHYHLHVTYIPVVRKEIKWSKRCKTPELVGTTKEVINQVSHSKKWKSTLEDGVMKMSYSRLQDDFWEHMQGAGFDVERGQKGSDKENLSAVEYKTQQEVQKLATVTEQVMQQMFQSEQLRRIIGVQEKVKMQRKELANIGKKALVGNDYKLTPAEMKKLKGLARIGVESQIETAELKLKNEGLEGKVETLTREVNEKAEKRSIEHKVLQIKYNELKVKYDELAEKTKPFMDAIERAGEKLLDFIKNVLHLKPEQEQESSQDWDISM